MTNQLIFISITLLSIAIIVIGKTLISRKDITLMSGMMVAMASGMMIGLTAGVIAGILFKGDLFHSTLIGASVGIIIGGLSGISVGLMGLLDGILSGLMGGMMGAMLGEMIDSSFHEIITRLVFILSLAIFFVLISITNKDTDKKKSIFRKLAFNPIFMTTTFGVIILASTFQGEIWREQNGVANSHQGHSVTENSEQESNKIIPIGTRDFSYLPNTFTVKEGEKVTVVLENTDEIEHDLELLTDKVKVYSLEKQHEHNETNPVHIHAKPKSANKITFVVLEEGTYSFICTIPGHEKAGMHGTIRVI